MLDITANKKLKTEGKSFLSVLKSEDNWNNRTIFWHSNKARPVNTGDAKSSVIREGDYKLIEFYEQNRIELYNIAKDPSEQHDISKENKQKVASLLKKLHQWKLNSYNL